MNKEQAYMVLPDTAGNPKSGSATLKVGLFNKIAIIQIIYNFFLRVSKININTKSANFVVTPITSFIAMSTNALPLDNNVAHRYIMQLSVYGFSFCTQNTGCKTRPEMIKNAYV